MKKFLILTFALSVFMIILPLGGCDKEKIVESTEYVHDIEYVELPPDTVLQVITDTVFVGDSNTTVVVDTVFVGDTLYQTDTVYQTNYVHDTTTVYVYDTVTTVQNHYDTVTVSQCEPDALSAFYALEAYSNNDVLEFINSEYGYDDGWVFYLSIYQNAVSQVSADVFDIYGYIDYWTPEWDAYLPLEYYWRMTFNDGDPSDPNNWSISEPPDAVSGHIPGLRIKQDTDVEMQKLR